MGDYNLAYTGPQVNAALAESARLVSEGGGASQQDLSLLDNKIIKIATGYSLSAASLNELKTGLLNIANSIIMNEYIGLRIFVSFTSDGFINGTTYGGYLFNIYKDGNTTAYFSANLYNNIGDNIIVGYNNGTWYFNSSGIKRKIVSVTISGFSAASSGFYYKPFVFSDITSNNVIAVNTVSYSGAWRALIWDHYKNAMCLYTNLNTDFSGTVEVFYL